MRKASLFLTFVLIFVVFSSIPPVFADWLSDQIEKANNWVNEQTEKANNWVDDQTKKAGEVIEQKASEAGQLLNEQVNKAEQWITQAAENLAAEGFTVNNFKEAASSVLTIVSNPQFQQTVVITAFKLIPIWDIESQRIVTFDTYMRDLLSSMDSNGDMQGSDLSNDPVAFGVTLFMDEDYMLDKARIWKQEDGTYTTLNQALQGGSSEASTARDNYSRSRDAIQSNDPSAFQSNLDAFAKSLAGAGSVRVLGYRWIKENLDAAPDKRYDNMRSGAGQSYTKLGEIPFNAKVELLEIVKGTNDEEWAKIRYGGNTGYIWYPFLTAIDPTSLPQLLLDTTRSGPRWVLETNVNFRQGPGTEYTILGQFQINDPVNVYGTTKGQDGKDWAKVQYKGKDGYVQADYLTTSNPVEVQKPPGIAKSDTNSTAQSSWLLWVIGGSIGGLALLIYSLARRKRASS